MDKKLKPSEKQLMLEEITFYSLCTALDREKILDQAPMTFDDFRRLSLLTDYLNLNSLHKFIWDLHANKFMDAIDELYEKCEMQNEGIPDMLMESAQWLDAFWKQAPNPTVAYLLHEIFSNGLNEPTSFF